MKNETKSFPLCDILSVTEGVIVSKKGIAAVYGILNFMSNNSLYTHQLPRAADECTPIIFSQHPFLNSEDIHSRVQELAELMDKAEKDNIPSLIDIFFTVCFKDYPKEIDITSCPDKCSNQDPIKELYMMREKNENLA